jgi:predicted transcriptional regulator
MPRCFVMQPFDGDEFDKRFDEIYKPAIEAAGFEPYRVDRDPSASIPIANIQDGIKDSAACFADITKDNPNVWFELGYAICANKPLCIICENTREKFPFDVQHRKIITYKKGSPSDFSTLRARIAERLNAIAESNEKLETIINEPASGSEDKLTQMEFSALCIVFENIDSDIDGIAMYNIANDMERIGFNKLATKVALTVLHKKGMVERSTKSDFDGSSFYVYDTTPFGEAYVLDNTSQIQFRLERTQIHSTIRGADPRDDDIPF